MNGILNKSFETRGSHNTVYPCSLPTWLPDDIFREMNHTFARKLREALVDLITDPESRKKHANSTGSSGRSSSDDEDYLDRAKVHIINDDDPSWEEMS